MSDDPEATRRLPALQEAVDRWFSEDPGRGELDEHGRIVIVQKKDRNNQ